MSMEKHDDIVVTVLIGKPEPFQTTLAELKVILENKHYGAFWKYPPLSAYQFKPDGVWLEDQHIAEIVQ